MLLAALAFVSRYGDNIPYGDELAMVEVMAGEQPITLDWLWSRHNEHRLFLPRLQLLGLYQLSGNDVRAGMFFNAGILGALAFAAIRVATALRGAVSYSDAFFPLVLLHWGQHHVFLIGFLQFAASTVLAGIILLIIVRCGNRLTLGPAVGAAICLLSLALCGGSGLALVPPLALWLTYATLLHGHPEQRRPVGGMILVFSLVGVALALVGVSLFLQVREPSLEPAPSLKGFVSVTLMVLTLSLGPAVMDYWPVSAVLVPGLFTLSTLVLVLTLVRRPSEKSRLLGLLMFLVAVTGLAMAVGWGRGGRSFSEAFSTTYVLLAVPGLLCVYFIWEALGPLSTGYFAQMCLFVLACALTLPNFQEGRMAGIREYHGPRSAFERDLLAGIPLSVLTEHHHLEWYSREGLASRLRSLKRAGVGKFRYLEDDPPSRKIELPVRPASMKQVVLQDGLGYGSGKDSYLAFTLDRSRLVYAIQLTYSYSNSDGASFRMSWGQAAKATLASQGSKFLQLPLPRYPDEKEEDQQTVTIWVNDTIDQFCIYPDNKPYIIKLSRIVLLVPTTEV